MAYNEDMPSGNQSTYPDGRSRWLRIGLALLIAPTVIIAILGVYMAVRLGADRPVVYDDIEEHFKYGSTGGERESGFPYWIFQAMPRVCSSQLKQYEPVRKMLEDSYRLPPDMSRRAFQALGMVFEEGRDLPVGMSKRRHMGLERTFLNCAVCHTSTVRDTPQSNPVVIVGMPANTFNIMGFQNFLFDCAKDEKFNAEYVIPEVRRLLKENHERHPEAEADLDVIDRYLVYPIAISIMRERLTMLDSRFAWARKHKPWGAGRVDTFNAAKVLFNFRLDNLRPDEANAPADFPSIWNQGQRVGMHLHWDGNNTEVEERNKNAAFGTGTTPPTIDLKAIGRVEKWLLTAAPPAYRYTIDPAKAALGEKVYGQYCIGCHGASGRNFSAKTDTLRRECRELGVVRDKDAKESDQRDKDPYGPYVGKITRLEHIGTDRHRLDSYSYELAVTLSTNYAGYDHRFSHFRKTFGYANMPLDGLWLRAPYLHNGSVPSLRELLKRAGDRVKVFYRGYDVYDPVNVGFVSDSRDEGARKYFRFDVQEPGNGNGGHDGPCYGTRLGESDKDALLEFLKTF